MTLKDLIDRLRVACAVEIRDFENNSICRTLTSSKGINPYLKYDVVSWFVSSNDSFCSFCVLIDDREVNNETDN